MSSFIQDLRHAVRTVVKSPAFSLTVIGTLALGIGANIAMFAVVSGVLFSPLPYRDADRLAAIWTRHVTTGSDRVMVSGPDFVDLRDRATTLEDMVAIHNAADNALTFGDGPAEQVDVGYVSQHFFQFLGVEPILGRSFTPDDELAAVGREAPMIMSYGLWTRRFGSDPDILGRTVDVSGQPAQVIGVLPPDFELLMPDRDGGATGGSGLDNVHLWRVLPEPIFRTNRAYNIFRAIGRVREGVSFAQAQEEVDAIAGQLREEHAVHQDRNVQIDIVPMHADVVASAKPVIWALFGAVGFVLLVACANVANLVLVRATHRRREVAVRVVLGARRGRIVQQLLTENGVLAVAGAGLGLLLARVVTESIVALAPASVPLLDSVVLGGRVAWFAIGVTMLSVVLFGLVPAVRAAQPDLRAQMTDGERSDLSSPHRLRDMIVVGELALSLVLLVGGGLMIRSFLNLQGARLGFDATAALTAKIALPHGAYDDPAVRATYWNGWRREASRLPGVDTVGIVWPLPFTESGAEVPYGATGQTGSDWGRYVATVTRASAGYFEAMGAVLVDGRTFDATDVTEDARTAVVDERVAERLYPGERAVGRTLWLQPAGAESVPLEIVGVVEHIRHQSVIGEERETIFRPTPGENRMAVVLRTNADPAAVVAGVQRVAASLDPSIPLFDVRTFDEYIAHEIAPTRFTMTLATGFAFVALALASIGLYGVISYLVAQRRAEFGIRMALGAGHGSIANLVVRHGMILTAAGIGIGLIASVAVTGLLRGLLAGVEPTDPLTLAGVAAVLAAVALGASYLPARRAARVPPAVVVGDRW